MKSENCVYSDDGRYVIGCYGKPTKSEIYYGKRIMDYFAHRNPTLYSDRLSMVGYQAIGSAVSNFKLKDGSSATRRSHFISEVYRFRNKINFASILANVDGCTETYRTLVFKKDDIACLF